MVCVPFLEESVHNHHPTPCKVIVCNIVDLYMWHWGNANRQLFEGMWKLSCSICASQMSTFLKLWAGSKSNWVDLMSIGSTTWSLTVLVQFNWVMCHQKWNENTLLTVQEEGSPRSRPRWQKTLGISLCSKDGVSLMSPPMAEGKS